MVRTTTTWLVSCLLACATVAPVMAGQKQITEIPAPVGQLVGLSGKVLLNHGEGFFPATADETISTGDRILLATAATASLSFPECNVQLAPGRVHIVSATPCGFAGEASTEIISPANSTSPFNPQTIVDLPPTPTLLSNPFVVGAGFTAMGLGVLYVTDVLDVPVSPY